ncbi:sulfite exporter TauE/SafE family protein [Agaribacterium haliotis]|uniref:sulfite exporter TauE/SafE family protein n=1 Tax=Agaribacterium haliotis TaxID=2013869 RepID=UPI000BB58E6E|nr:sulfite exporter TauE/SafE family protein [Agaribacterium haliotis]
MKFNGPSAATRRVFYVLSACALLYFFFFGAIFVDHLRLPELIIAPIMAFGSFVAGATFLGGGAVAFPALTKLMSIDALDAKSFSLAIQSVGMSAASFYIVVRVRQLPWAFIGLYVLASGCGMYVALDQLQYRIASIDLRISFSLFLLCFLAIYLVTRNSHNRSTDPRLEKSVRDISLSLAAGFCGGLVSGLLGSGADLIGFSLLALYFRIEIKRATQISVILMALTAVLGFVLQAAVYNAVSEQVWSLWYIAAPVVLFGAPLGALACRRMRAQWLLLFICAIVAVELLSTAVLVPLDRSRILYYALAMFVSAAALACIVYLSKHKHR